MASEEKMICVTLGSAFIEGIGEESSLFELCSLPLLFRELHDDTLSEVFRIKIASKVLVWGDNKLGQLGLGDGNNRALPEVASFLTDKQIIALKFGDYHSIALSADGKVYSCGDNSMGQLGTGGNAFTQTTTHALIKSESFGNKLIISIACGTNHSFALSDTGAMYSWGNNGSRQLGIDPQFVGGASIPMLVSTLQDRQISSVFSANFQAFVKTRNDEVYAWGSNEAGQLGVGLETGDDFQLRFPKLVQPQIKASKKVVSIATGALHSLALLDNGDVLFAGNTNFGYAGFQIDRFYPVVELASKHIISICCGAYHCLVLQNTGELYSWGDSNSQLGYKTTGKTITEPKQITAFEGKHIEAISCGSNHNLVLLKTGEVYSWGSNLAGQLGRGADGKPKEIPAIIEALTSFNVISIGCGSNSSMAFV